MYIGEHHIKLSKTTSTNVFLQQLLYNDNSIKEGTIVSAEHQEQGKGLDKNIWYSDAKKNILLSLFLQPEFLNLENYFSLNQFVSIGILNYLKQYIPEKNIYIKWPNDIYINTNKICGILIHNTLKNNKITKSIIGIGLNINQTIFSKIIKNPTSLKLHTKTDYDIMIEIKKLCESLQYFYLKLLAKDFETLNNLYLKKLYQLNEKAMYEDKTGYFYGKIKGITKEGFLIVKHENGNIKQYDFKEIQFVN